MSDKDEKTLVWQTSEAKMLLYNAIIAGVIPLDNGDMGAREVFDHCKDFFAEEFAQVEWKNFSSRLRDLRKVIRDKNSRADRDAAALSRDRAIFPPHSVKDKHGNELHWPDSEAFQLLKQDIDNGKHQTMKPEALWKSRPEYESYDKKVFRGHIYQEVKSRKFAAFIKAKRDKSGLRNIAMEEVNPDLSGIHAIRDGTRLHHNSDDEEE